MDFNQAFICAYFDEELRTFGPSAFDISNDFVDAYCNLPKE